ncbi:MAG: 50S ribosomal protein L10 [Desulfobulbus propionicus]|nr:MAG: 50S ribosomal protein L10 [Desulfobulbus propionicus]
MDRNQKTDLVSELNETFSRAKFAVVTDYRGLKVTELEQLRLVLRETDTRFQIAKNTLLRLAVKGTDYEGLSDSFTGTTAVAFSFEEPVGPAKALTAFCRENEALQIRTAMLEGKVLNADDVVTLSRMPGREELLAKLLGTMSAVPTGFVRVLNAIPQKLVYGLQAIKEQKEKEN